MREPGDIRGHDTLDGRGPDTPHLVARARVAPAPEPSTRAAIEGATSGPDARSATATPDVVSRPGPGRSRASEGGAAPDDLAAEVVARRLHQVAGIVDHPSRERAARRLEWQLVQWTKAAGRMRRGAHADSRETPKRAVSPPWS